MGLLVASLARKRSSVVQLGVSPSTGSGFAAMLADVAQFWTGFGVNKSSLEPDVLVFRSKMGVFKAKMARFPRKTRNRETDKKS